MDVVERYLQAVRFLLRGAQQDHIVRELSENLLSQIEDRAERLGRPLTADEQADILRAHGHPLVVAGRYQPGGHLIGPTLFPFYVFVLKLGLAVALVVSLALAVVAALLNPEPLRQMLQGPLAFPHRALQVFAWTTLGFAAWELGVRHSRVTLSWEPRTLPRAIRAEPQRSPVQAVGAALLAIAFAVWLLLLPWAPQLGFGPAASFIEPGPIWGVAYPPVLIVVLAGALIEVTAVRHPYWTRARAYARLALSAASLVIALVLLRSMPLFVAAPPSTWSGGADAEGIAHIINGGFALGLVAWLIIAIVEIAREMYRLLEYRDTSATPAAAP